MGTENKLQEINLINFSQLRLVSPNTQQYADERETIMGQAQPNIRLMDVSIDGDNARFTFYSYATDKYGDDHVYMDANEDKNFQLERNPIALYEIYLQFNGVNKLKNTKATLNDIKNWLWEQDFLLYSNVPSFHWSGSNYVLSQLGGSLYPTNIKPKKPSNQDRGPLDKHTYSLMVSIKWYIAQMAGQLLNRLRTQGYVSKYQRPSRAKQPTETAPMTSFDAQVQDNLDQLPDDEIDTTDTDEITPEESDDMLEPQPEPMLSNEPPTSPLNKTKTNVSGVNAEVTKPQESRRHQYSGELMQENIHYSRTPNGYEASFTVNKKPYKLSVDRSPAFLESSITEYDTHSDRFFYESDTFMAWDQRMKVNQSMKPMVELGLFLSGGTPETLLERDEVKTNFNRIVTNILEHDSLDIASLVLESGSTSFSNLITEISDDFASVGFKTFNMVDSKTLVPRSFIFKEDSKYNEIFRPILKEARKDDTLIMAYGAFSPPTSDHIAFLKSMVASGQKSGSQVMLFLQPNEELENSAATLRQEQAILRAIPGLESLNICLEEGIRDIYDALTYVYNTLKKENLILMCGSDQELVYQGMIEETNGKRTPNGYYSFKKVKVVSTGRPNPDKSEKASLARNAILNGDFKAFIKGANLPYLSSFQVLFDLMRNGASQKIGVS